MPVRLSKYTQQGGGGGGGERALDVNLANSDASFRGK